MTPLPVTPADARLLRAAASLCRSVEPRKRAAHLEGQCTAFAQRIEDALRKGEGC